MDSCKGLCKISKICIIDHKKDSSMEYLGVEPWSLFFDAITSRGNEIVGVYENPDVVVFMNHHPKIVRKLKRTNLGAIRILVLWESKVTRPSDFQTKSLKEYDFIFSPSHKWISGRNVSYFCWPSELTMNMKFQEEHQRDSRVIMLLADKYSFVHDELYSLRRSYVKHNQGTIVVYGQNWNSGITSVKLIVRAFLKSIITNHNSFPKIRKQFFFQNAKNYKGISIDKNVLARYRYSLVIENQANYVSEKLFDSLMNDCITFYIGPELREFGIPENIVYPLSGSNTDVRDLAEIISKESFILQQIALNARKFINSEKASLFQNRLVLHELGSRIAEISENIS